jgi:hypothetical protein
MGEARRRLQFDLSHGTERLIFPEDIPLLIRQTAEELAGAFHDEAMEDARFSPEQQTRHRSQQFRAHWGKDSRRYVKLNWPTFVPMAKGILTSMLTRADVTLTMKDAIYEAFLEVGQDRNQLDLSEALQAAPVQGNA